jgi:cytochrome c peroxidase
MGRRPHLLTAIGAALVAALALGAAGPGDREAAQGTPDAAPAIRTVQVDVGDAGDYAPAPLGLDPVPVPPDNPQTPAKVALGRLLFFDPRLSSDGTIACASCHNPALGWSNGLSFAFGVRGQTGRRSAPTVLNAAYDDTLFWDGRAPSLEAQAKGPLTNPVEMGAQDGADVARRLAAVPAYAKRFAEVFGTQEVTFDAVVKAIAAYERTLLSADSPFDRYTYGGDRSALTGPQVRGLALFKDKDGPNCAKCHRFDDFSALFTDLRFHNVGVGTDRPGPDPGREAVTGRPEDRGKFRTPSLRNVALTAPYMHDGRFATLEQVVDYYAKGGQPNPNLDSEIRPFTLTARQKADLIAFLNALTGDLPAVQAPALP